VALVFQSIRYLPIASDSVRPIGKPLLAQGVRFAPLLVFYRISTTSTKWTRSWLPRGRIGTIKRFRPAGHPSFLYSEGCGAGKEGSGIGSEGSDVGTEGSGFGSESAEDAVLP